MGLQLSVLVGCVGALELLACLRHVIVCVMKLTDQPANCCIGYFHRSRISDHDFVILEKPSTEEADNKQACSEIEAILRENRSEPDILCLGPPAVVDGYVRIPTPIPFGVDDEPTGQKSSSNVSSLVDSGNENPTTRKSVENLAVTAKTRSGSSSDVSSLEDTEKTNVKPPPKKILRRSRTPEFHAGSYDDYDDGEEEESGQHQKKHHKASKTTLSATSQRRSARSKSSKSNELGRSAENLSTTSRRSKRHREPERCKSDIQIQVARNLHRDEWTNTSPMGSEADSLGNLSRASSKRSISVLIQTSFEDKLQFPENGGFQNFEVGGSKLLACPNCRCGSEVRRVTETGESVDGKPQLVKVSSFEEASGDDYEKLKNVINAGGRGSAPNNWIKSSLDSESFDEYQDAEEEGVTFCEQPIQFRIPDPGDNQAFWVKDTTPRRHVFESHIPFYTTSSSWLCSNLIVERLKFCV